jgi:Lrp/AsnC family transcriptional regulator for asnA, asnC and gidA
MDEKDLAILKQLRRDSRESMGRIAEDLEISKATVSRRISRMEKDGVISGYSIDVNPSRIGLMRALLSLEVIGSSVNAVVDELRKFKEVKRIYKVFGDHSLICDIYSPSVDSLYSLIQDKLLNLPNIHNVEVDILVDRIDLNPNADIDLLSTTNVEE